MRTVWQRWQEREGGPLVTPKGPHPWYVLAQFGWRKSYRVAELQRHPLCCQCQERASEVVDHIKPFISPEGYVSWALYSDPANHRALCRECHSILTATYDGGFGNVRKHGKETHVMATGAPGKQYLSTSVGTAAIDRALGTREELNELLSGIPEL